MFSEARHDQPGGTISQNLPLSLFLLHAVQLRPISLVFSENLSSKHSECTCVCVCVFVFAAAQGLTPSHLIPVR